VAVDVDRARAARPRWGQAPRRVRALGGSGVSGSGSSSGGTSGWPGINRGTLLGEEKGEFVNLQGEPDEGRPGRGRPGGVYIIVAAIVAIAIVVLLIILIF